MNKKKLLEIKAIKKKKQPYFIRPDHNKRKRIPDSWRKPRGVHNKVRRAKRGQEAKVKVGWCSPKEVRGLDRNGLKPVLVYNLADLEKINPKEEIIIIGRVGQRKKVELIKKAEEKGFKILNVKSTKDYLEQVNKEMEGRKKIKKERELKKETRKKEAEKKKEEKKETKKETGTEEKTETEVKKEEKKEKDKILTKKN